MPEQPIDRFGNPVPVDPGYKEIWNADGTKPQQWEKLVLDGLTVTSDPLNRASILHVTPPTPEVLGRTVQTVESVTGALRSFALPAPRNNIVFQTLSYGVYGAGLGGWQYIFDDESEADDDGVLVIKADFIDTGRFVAVKPADGIMNALSCGPAASDLGTRTKSFDPTGVVAIGSEAYRVTALLRAAGWGGLEFPNAGTCYKHSGAEQIAPSATPNTPFYYGSKTGARLQGNVGDHVAVMGMGCYARGLGDVGTTATIIAPDHAGNLTFTQTIYGGERTFVGVSNVLGLAVGDYVAVYLGAEITDISGWCADWMIAQVQSIAITGSPVGNVTVNQTTHGPMPATPGSRGAQNSHTMRKMVGFADSITISGFRLNNIFIGHQGARNCVIDCHWERAVFQHNHFMCDSLRIPSYTADHVTGYDQLGEGPGHGALSWYGGGAIIQSCYGTDFGIVKCYDLDGVSLITEELSSRGTHIGLLDCTWDATNAPTSTCPIVGQTGGSTDIISIDHMILRGGQAFASIVPSCRIGVYEDRGSSEYQGVNISAGQCERLVWRGQGYRDKRRFQMAIPIPASGNVTVPVPCNGIIRCMLLQVRTSATFETLANVGVTTLAVDGTVGFSSYEITNGYITAKDTWFPIHPASILVVGAPNGKGYCEPRIFIDTDGTTPAGSFLHVDVEMFLPELETSGQPQTTDTSLPMIRGGSGAPSFNAGFIGQEYIDSVASPRKWYKAVNVGTGASDWVALS